MRRRSSGSTEEDETDQAALVESESLEDDGREHGFTTSKFDVTRHSDTLDRRKVEKALLSTPLNQQAWASEPDTYGASAPLDRPLGPAPQSAAPAMMSDQQDRRGSRTRSPWRSSMLTLTVTALSIGFIYAIVRSLISRQLDPKGCNMSYMSPMYAKLSDFDTEHTRFASKYSLYLYREDGIDQDTMVRGHVAFRNED